MQKSGSIITEFRKKYRWSQRELAEKVGVKQPSVADWESDRKTPSDENFLKLAEIFGVDRETLVGSPRLSEEDLRDLFEKFKSLSFSQQLACAAVIREFYELPSNRVAP
jgi:transcriptional regulator with XRE-family HTH domain